MPNMPVAIRAAPGRSIGMRAWRSLRLISTMAPSTASGAMITLMPKAQRHEWLVVSQPPSTGPKATAAPAAAPQAAKAVARSRPWKMLESRARVDGTIRAAPMPSMTASPRISQPTVGERAAISEPTPNSDTPITNRRRWPKMSPRRPPMIRRLAKVSE